MWNAFESNDVNLWLQNLCMLAFTQSKSRWRAKRYLYDTPFCYEKEGKYSEEDKTKFDRTGKVKNAYCEWIKVIEKYMDGKKLSPQNGNECFFKIDGITQKFIIKSQKKPANNDNKERPSPQDWGLYLYGPNN